MVAKARAEAEARENGTTTTTPIDETPAPRDWSHRGRPATKAQRKAQTNKSFVNKTLAEMTEQERTDLNQIAQLPIFRMYLMPAKQVDDLHRLFMRIINKSRLQIMDNMKREAAAAEQAKKDADAAKMAETVPAADPASATPAAPVEPTAAPAETVHDHQH